MFQVIQGVSDVVKNIKVDKLKLVKTRPEEDEIKGQLRNVYLFNIRIKGNRALERL